jgi:hypothetical protein
MSRQRYEKEIEEILANAGESAPPSPERNSEDPPRRRDRTPSTGPRVPGGRFGLKYQYPLLAGIVLILIGAFLHWPYFFFAGLALVALGYILYYRAPRGGQGSSRTPRAWRGRSMDS